MNVRFQLARVGATSTRTTFAGWMEHTNDPRPVRNRSVCFSPLETLSGPIAWSATLSAVLV